MKIEIFHHYEKQGKEIEKQTNELFNTLCFLLITPKVLRTANDKQVIMLGFIITNLQQQKKLNKGKKIHEWNKLGEILEWELK